MQTDMLSSVQLVGLRRQEKQILLQLADIGGPAAEF